jgi:Protein of unknown function (DUF3142)
VFWWIVLFGEPISQIRTPIENDLPFVHRVCWCKLDAFKSYSMFIRAHSSRRITGFLVIFLIVTASLVLGYAKARSVFSKRDSAPTDTNRKALPPLMLWAWERPTDLTFLNPKEAGVAFLARTIHLQGEDVTVRPRLQPLKLPEGISLIAVARVESDSRVKPALSVQQRTDLVKAIAEMATLPNISSIQIDFDATLSERAFYRDAIKEVRQRLPKGIRLSITALASWCADDDWLSDLPIDEAVPMLFRMGPDGKQIANRLANGGDFSAVPCRESYGISTDESRRGLSPGRRFYVFNPDAWTETSVRALLELRK